MFKAYFSDNNKIWGCTKNSLGRTAPDSPRVYGPWLNRHQIVLCWGSAILLAEIRMHKPC